jgi:hypothetical protein
VFEANTALEAISLPGIVEMLSGCFLSCKALASVQFDPGFAAPQLGAKLFSGCGSLFSICIPASVTAIMSDCFTGSGLVTVEFAPGSQLRTIESGAFSCCTRLTSFAVVPSVESLGAECLAGSTSLSEVIFHVGSTVGSSEQRLFSHCPKLTQLCVPSSVAMIDVGVFDKCSSLAHLTFELPSRLVEIRSLPIACLETVDIPDSVRILNWDTKLTPRLRSLIRFGPHSSLESAGLFETPPSKYCQFFLSLPERFLKERRDRLEFPKRAGWSSSPSGRCARR